MALKVTATVTPQDKHQFDVTSLIFVQGQLYSSSDDGKIKVWSPDLQLVREAQAHACSVYSTATDGKGSIFTCSNDGTVRSWDQATLQEKQTLLTSEREFWKLWCTGSALYAVNDAGIISIHVNGKKTGEIETLEQIKDLAVCGSLVYTVSDLDLVIAELMSDKGRTMTRRTFEGRAPLCLAGDRLCFSSRDGRNVVTHYKDADKQFKESVRIDGAHEKLINALVGYENESDKIVYLYSADYDGTVKLWYLLPDGGHKAGPSCCTGACVNVLCLSDDRKMLFAAGADGVIWKLEMTQ